MNRAEFIIVTAIILFIAFALGWFAHWLIHRFTRVSGAEMGELDRMAQALHDAEETRDQAITYLQQREAELSNQQHQTEAELRAGVTLLSRQSKPALCLGVVLRDAFTGGVLEPDVVLRLGVALLSPRTLRNAPLYPERPPVVWSRGVQRRGRTGGRVELVELPHPRAPRLVELGRLHHAGHRDRVDGAVQS